MSDDHGDGRAAAEKEVNVIKAESIGSSLNNDENDKQIPQTKAALNGGDSTIASVAATSDPSVASTTAEITEDERILRIETAPNGNDGTIDASASISSAASVASAATANANPALTEESVYEYYKETLFPALMSSLPILFERVMHDSKAGLAYLFCRIVGFLVPGFLLPAIRCCSNGDNEEHLGLLAGAGNFKQVAALRQLWEQTVMSKTSSNSTIAEFLLGQFDTNRDGHISPSELLDLGEIMKRWDMMIKHQNQQMDSNISWWTWFSREWPLMDWKIGVFIWKTFGGLLVLITLLSILPGRFHSVSARILRWPVLGLTYFLVGVELGVYIVIRLFIRLCETLFAKPKHRKLRRCMAEAEDFQTWYKCAKELDQSKKRDEWQGQIQDETSCRYNWSFIKELMADMRHARATKDSFLAMAVLQQCTRKNVGGIMSEDLFSYTYTGEPKHIVREFVKEVETTLKWVTDEALKVPIPNNDNEEDLDDNDPTDVGGDDDQAAKESYEKQLEQQVKREKDKLWGSVMAWATLSFRADGMEEFKQQPKPTKQSQQQQQQQVHGTKRAQQQKNAKKRKDGFQKVNNDGSRDHPEITFSRDSDSETSTVTTHESESSASHPAPGSQLPPIHREQVLTLLKRARAAYGRTALCLSGGSVMGMYHFGHAVGLLERGLLPHIISGTSAGSVVGAVLCTRTDEELKRDLHPAVLAEKFTCFSRPWPERIKSFIKNGTLFDFDEWHALIKFFTNGDLTFEEAYKRTGRIFCITLSATTKKAPPVLLNYLSAPNVTIASAVVASAAVPGCIEPVSLRYKDADGNIRTSRGDNKDQTYFDGSIDSDIPINGLAEMLNCQFYIACQCNPHIVPFFFDAKGGVGRPSRWSSDRQEHTWRGGFLLAALEMYLKNDMKAKMVFLNDVEAAVGFTSTMLTQQFHGSTTIVPQVSFWDYFGLFSNPSREFVEYAFQSGSVAAYQHCSMIKLHYSIADALEQCIAKLEGKSPPKNRTGINLKSKRNHQQDHHHHDLVGTTISSSNTNDSTSHDNGHLEKKKKKRKSRSTSSSRQVDNESLRSSSGRDSACSSPTSSSRSSHGRRRRNRVANSADSTTGTTSSIGDSSSYIYEGNCWIDEHTIPKFQNSSPRSSIRQQPMA